MVIESFGLTLAVLVNGVSEHFWRLNVKLFFLEHPSSFIVFLELLSADFISSSSSQSVVVSIAKN